MPGTGEGDGADILGKVVNGIGSGLKLGLKTFTETIQIKQIKQYFAVKNGVLYQYSHERSRESEKHIDIKQTKAIEISPDNPREFYIVIKKKCYRFLCELEGEAQKWVNSLKAIKEGGFSLLAEEHLDSNRYEKLKVYSRVTGKSMYKEYDSLLETYEDTIHGAIEVKLMDYLQKNKRLKTIESTITKSMKKEIQNRKQSVTAKNAIASKQDQQKDSNAFHQEEENFVKGL